MSTSVVYNHTCLMPFLATNGKVFINSYLWMVRYIITPNFILNIRQYEITLVIDMKLICSIYHLLMHSYIVLFGNFKTACKQAIQFWEGEGQSHESPPKPTPGCTESPWLLEYHPTTRSRQHVNSLALSSLQHLLPSTQPAPAIHPFLYQSTHNFIETSLNHLEFAKL